MPLPDCLGARSKLFALNVRQKIADWCVNINELIVSFAVFMVPMIALWVLIVVANQALARSPVEQSIRVVVRATKYRCCDAPNHHVKYGCVIKQEIAVLTRAQPFTPIRMRGPRECQAGNCGTQRGAPVRILDQT